MFRINGNSDRDIDEDALAFDQSCLGECELERHQAGKDRFFIMDSQMDQKLIPVQSVNSQIVREIHLEHLSKLFEDLIGKSSAKDFVIKFEIIDINA